MQEKRIAMKELMRKAGITLGDVANETGASRADVCRVLDESLSRKIKAGALKLIRERNRQIVLDLAQYE